LNPNKEGGVQQAQSRPDSFLRRVLVPRWIARLGKSVLFRAPYSTELDILVSAPRLGRWIREEGREAKICANRVELYRAIIEATPGPKTYLEFGTYKGESIFAMAEIDREPESRFFGFDTFVGLPEDWRNFMHVDPRGHFNADGIAPASNDRRIRFVKGLFQETLPAIISEIPRGNRFVIHLDADIYTATLFVLTFLDAAGIIRSGTVAIFDEFPNAIHEFRALDDHSRSYRRRHKPIGATANFLQTAILFGEVA
jgi:O-methyltransferase